MPSPTAPDTGNAASVHRSPHWTRTVIGDFADPYGVAVNPTCMAHCNVFVADPGSRTVWKVAPDGNKTALMDAAKVGSSFDPQSVAVDPQGGLSVADKAGAVWFYDMSTGVASPLAGPPCKCFGHWRGAAIAPHQFKAGQFTLYFSWVTNGFAAHGPGIYWTDGRQLTDTGSPPANFDPYGIAADRYRRIFVADARGKRILRLTLSCGCYDDYSPNKTFSDPYGVAVTWDGQWLYVADAGAKQVDQRAPDGTWSVVERFGDPYGVAADGANNLYVADPGTKKVYKLTR